MKKHAEKKTPKKTPIFKFGEKTPIEKTPVLENGKKNIQKNTFLTTIVSAAVFCCIGICFMLFSSSFFLPRQLFFAVPAAIFCLSAVFCFFGSCFLLLPLLFSTNSGAVLFSFGSCFVQIYGSCFLLSRQQFSACSAAGF